MLSGVSRPSSILVDAAQRDRRQRLGDAQVPLHDVHHVDEQPAGLAAVQVEVGEAVEDSASGPRESSAATPGRRPNRARRGFVSMPAGGFERYPLLLFQMVRTMWTSPSRPLSTKRCLASMKCGVLRCCTPDLHHAPRLPHGLDQGRPLLRARRHRLFDVDVLAGAAGVGGDARVRVVPGGDDHGVDVLAVEQAAVVGNCATSPPGDLGALLAGGRPRRRQSATHWMPSARLASPMRYLPRPPVPMMPRRMRSLAPGTRAAEAAETPAPSRVRRESDSWEDSFHSTRRRGGARPRRAGKRRPLPPYN